MNTKNDYTDLQARFTSWIRIVIQRARLDYLKYQKRHVRDIPVGLIDSNVIGNIGLQENSSAKDFLFQNRSLEDAFYKLPFLQQRVLYMRIVRGFSPAEIANLMGCDSAKISRQYYKALSALRHQLCNRGNTDEG